LVLDKDHKQSIKSVSRVL